MPLQTVGILTGELSLSFLEIFMEGLLLLPFQVNRKVTKNFWLCCRAFLGQENTCLLFADLLRQVSLPGSLVISEIAPKRLHCIGALKLK